MEGKGCSKCKVEKIVKSSLLTTEEWISDATKVHGNKYDYSKVNYINAKTKVCIICPKHGEFWQLPWVHKKGVGCPKCNESHMEKEMRVFLDEHNIKFEEQKKFDWLGRQSLDFYLPELNTAIECQGEQHFKPTRRMGGVKKYKVIQERDQRKAKLCQENGVQILYYTNIHLNKDPYSIFRDKDEMLKKVLIN